MEPSIYSTSLPKIQRLPFVADSVEKVLLTEELLQSKCYALKHQTIKKATKKSRYAGVDLHHQHLWKLCLFDRFSFLVVCDLSNNFLDDILALSTCMNLTWLDIHDNHIEDFPDEYFWTGLVSLRILNAHNNPISQLLNVKFLSACQNLEVLTLFDTPVSVHPFYRHCCVNKISSLKALDHHLIADDEVIEAFLCPPKFTKFSSGLKVKLLPNFNEGISGVFSVLREVNKIQAKMSPCLFIQRVYRGYRCRKMLEEAFRIIGQKRQKGVHLSSSDIFNLTAVEHLTDADIEFITHVPDRRKLFDKDHLPPIIPPATTPQKSLNNLSADSRSRTATMFTPYSVRLILHKLMHSSAFEGALNAIRSRRMDGMKKEYVRQVAEAVFEEAPDSGRTSRSFSRTDKSIANSRNNIMLEDGLLLTKPLSPHESLVDMGDFRVPSSYDLINLPLLPSLLSLEEAKQIEAQMIKQADIDYHAHHHVQSKKEMADKQDERDFKPVNMNAVRDKVVAEEHLTQQLACLAAVEKAYHERSYRETRFVKASSVLASREATTQAIRKQSALVTSARETLGHAVRTERHLTHHLLDRIRDKEVTEKKAAYRKHVEERVARRNKMESFRAVADLRQRFCAISASINRYDWVNRQHGLVQRARVVVEQTQQAKIAANVYAAERDRKRTSETQAVNQLEIRRAHQAIELASELDLDLAKKRVDRVKSERPERLPPQLPGPSSMSIDGICHAAYNPIVGNGFLPVIETSRDGRISSLIDNGLPKPEVVDIRERWRILAAVPDGRIGLHPITADIN